MQFFYIREIIKVSFGNVIEWSGRVRTHLMYFSPTGTTQKVLKRIEQDFIIHDLDYIMGEEINITPLEHRQQSYAFNENELLFLGLPVYAGRVPNILLKFLDELEGNGAYCVPIVLYGNRNYDDALKELTLIAQARGFKVIAAAAFIGEHSFSYDLAKGRPDASDLKIADEFAEQIMQKIKRLDKASLEIDLDQVPGENPLRAYYRPKDREGNFFDFRPIKPITLSTCVGCMICNDVCPTHAIDDEDSSLIRGMCIKCGACVKGCPEGAKVFNDVNYLKHKKELEEDNAEPQAPFYIL